MKNKKIDFEGDKTAEWLIGKINSGEPFMAGRFGEVELTNMLELHYISNVYPNISLREKFRNYVYLRRNFTWSLVYKNELMMNAGFFPVTIESLKRFDLIMKDAMIETDLLGSWVKGENIYEEFLRNAKITSLGSLEPYFFKKPWSQALKGKKVLVVNPFSDSISKQYQINRERLFPDSNILPEFELIVFKSVQSIAGRKTEFETWFDALDYMTKSLEKIDFDIAIIGCGAYGFPLAANIKKMGKQAIHLGGATQFLFGVTGKRWEDDHHYSKFTNEYWIRPDKNETPKGFKIIEGGCYW